MKQAANIALEHNYADTGSCNVTSSLSLPDQINIVADVEVDDADTDNSECQVKSYKNQLVNQLVNS